MKNVMKNIVSIICGVVALLAVVAAFWPLGGYLEQLQEAGNTRVAVAGQINDVANKKRQWPKIDPNPTVRPMDLTQFPSAKVNDLGDKQKALVHSQAIGMMQFAYRVNARSPLTANSLPYAPPAVGITFRTDLEREIERLRDNVLKGGVPPTQANVEKRAAELWEKKYVPQKIMIENNTKWQNEKDLKEAFDAEKAGLPALMRKEIATEKKMYVDDLAFPPNPNITGTGGQAPPPAAIWFAQVGLWLQQDVCETIAQMNAPSKSIEEAPVKRLLRMDLATDANLYVRDPTAGGGAESAGAGFAPQMPVLGGRETLGRPLMPQAAPAPGAAPAANGPMTDPSAPLLRSYAASPTGRVCNGLYDVVQFRLIVDVGAAQVQPFLKRLSANRFLTIRNVDLTGIDYKRTKDEGFDYGNAPVVQLNLDCEELFLREWTAPIMPSTVKSILGFPDAYPAILAPPARTADAR